MAGLKAESSRWPVPSDWNEAVDGYQFVVLCIPNSRTWRGIFVGQIDSLTYGRSWNRHSGTITEAQEIAQGIFEGMIMTCAEDLIQALNCICDKMTVLAEKTGTAGQETEGGLSDGGVIVGPGEQFPDQTAYFDAKCNVSNGIFDTVRDMAQWLDDNNADLLIGLFGGVTSGLIVAATLSGPVGWAMMLTVSVISAIASYLISITIEFSDLVDALDDTHDECVLALFNASNSLVAEDNFIAAVRAGTPTITDEEAGLVRIVLTAEMLNQLYSPRSDLAAYQSPSAVDCGAFTAKTWSFPTDQELWVFADVSSGGASSTGSYDAVLEALSVNIIIPGGVPDFGNARWTSPNVAIAVTPGASVQADYSDTSDGERQGVQVTVIYSDLTEETAGSAHSGAGTEILTLTQTKTIQNVRVEINRGPGVLPGSDNFVTTIPEVRVITA